MERPVYFVFVNGRKKSGPKSRGQARAYARRFSLLMPEVVVKVKAMRPSYHQVDARSGEAL